MAPHATAAFWHGPLGCMADLVPQVWPALEPLCLHEAHGCPDELGRALRTRAHEQGRGHHVTDLEALLAGWPHYDNEQRAVLGGTVRYLTTECVETPSPDVEDDVVAAAVRAVMSANT